jgi:hypothetical protein
VSNRWPIGVQITKVSLLYFVEQSQWSSHDLQVNYILNLFSVAWFTNSAGIHDGISRATNVHSWAQTGAKCPLDAIPHFHVVEAETHSKLLIY